MKTELSPGKLITLRGREWIIQPSDDEDLLLIKPLGGTEEEITGIYKPLATGEDEPKEAQFQPPSSEDLGDISSSRLLYDAARLAFRNGSGPFRSLAKLSFRPRAYQIVPLVMALKQDPIRLLIADDVGVGKTVEALLILKEAIERKTIKRFAVLCPPHLCEQWQEEIQSKIGVEAVIIRTNTQARLDREIRGDISVFEYYPWQIISIDYIKSDKRRNVFIQQAPEMIVVDEAHTCTRPGTGSGVKQQRYKLINSLAKKDRQHILLLTATPHSGKPEEFQSLLGLIDSDFETWDLRSSTQKQRISLARHFIQRKRADVKEWLGEGTPFPKRESFEFSYELSDPYGKLFEDILKFTRRLVSTNTNGTDIKLAHYWVALALLRGVMSSPAAGIKMLKSRMNKLATGNTADEEITDHQLITEQIENPVGDMDIGFESDSEPTQLVEKNDWSKYQRSQLNQFAGELEGLSNIEDDQKLYAANMVIEEWIDKGFYPVIFCRYIETANYLGEKLKAPLNKKYPKIALEVLTSESPDELRKQKIKAMEGKHPRVLIATECLSEGINLQDYFTAVMHYDLPWNPNRLEQREGRVDRFGQRAAKVETCFLYGEDNPIDAIVLDVLLRKVREIKKQTGINVPFPEDSQSIIDTITKALLINPERQIQKEKESKQRTLFSYVEFPEAFEAKERVSRKIDKAAEREKKSHSIFAQYAKKTNEIERALRETDEAIGTPEDVERFTITTLNDIFGVQTIKTKKGYDIITDTFPAELRGILPDNQRVKVSFDSPTPEAHIYLGRNHLFVEQLCRVLMANTLEKAGEKACRAAVIRTGQVQTKTTLLLLRCRNVIEQGNKSYRIVSEEMLLGGWEGAPEDDHFIDHDDAQKLLQTVKASSDLSKPMKTNFLNNELRQIQTDWMKAKLDTIAEKQNLKLADSHQRFSTLVGKKKFQVVKPIMPMDIMGLYILLPEVSR